MSLIVYLLKDILKIEYYNEITNFSILYSDTAYLGCLKANALSFHSYVDNVIIMLYLMRSLMIEKSQLYAYSVVITCTLRFKCRIYISAFD